MKHFTILEKTCEYPMIATIDNVTPNLQGFNSFIKRLEECIKDHFDIGKVTFGDNLSTTFNELMKRGEIKSEITVRLEDYSEDVLIQILETWIY